MYHQVMDFYRDEQVHDFHHANILFFFGWATKAQGGCHAVSQRNRTSALLLDADWFVADPHLGTVNDTGADF